MLPSLLPGVMCILPQLGSLSVFGSGSGSRKLQRERMHVLLTLPLLSRACYYIYTAVVMHFGPYILAEHFITHTKGPIPKLKTNTFNQPMFLSVNHSHIVHTY